MSICLPRMEKMLLKERVRTERLLEKSGRITPRWALAAYDRTGLRPGLMSFLDEDRACAFGAIMVDSGVDPVSGEYEDFERRFEAVVGRSYLKGFYNGFDGLEGAPTLYDSLLSRANKGYRDGCRVRKFVEARFGEEALYAWN